MSRSCALCFVTWERWMGTPWGPCSTSVQSFLISAAVTYSSFPSADHRRKVVPEVKQCGKLRRAGAVAKDTVTLMLDSSEGALTLAAGADRGKASACCVFLKVDSLATTCAATQLSKEAAGTC